MDTKVRGGALRCHCPSLEGHWDDGYPPPMTTQPMNNHHLMDNDIHIYLNFGSQTCPYYISMLLILPIPPRIVKTICY